MGGSATMNGTHHVTLSSLVVSPANASQLVGQSVGYTLTGTFSNGVVLDLTRYALWTSSNSAIAGYVSLTNTKNARCNSAGTAEIKAIYGLSSAFTHIICNGTVPPPPSLSSIAVTPGDPNVPVGQIAELTATGTYSDGSHQDLTAGAAWVSSNTTNATIGPLNSARKVKCVHGGTSTITATFTAVSGNTVITCKAALVSIAVTPASPSILVGSQQSFIATGTYTDSTVQDVTSQATWTSGTPATATINTATNPQLATALTAGTSLITATVGIVSGSTTLTVTSPGPPPPTLASVVVTPAAPSVNVGQSLTFIATGVYSDSSTVDVTTQATWQSLTPSVATLGALGTTQSATCILNGSSVIRATFQAVVGNSTLTCINPPPTLVSLVVTPTAPSIDVGQSIGMVATGTYSDGSTRDITTISTWTSLTPAVASIGAPFSDPQPVNCLTAGTSAIRAAVDAVNNSSTLTCNATLVSIVVTPALPTINVGRDQAFIATGTYSDGTQKNVSSQSTWASLTTSVATLSGSPTTSQLTRCIAAGTSVIRATVGSINGQTTLTCAALPPPAPTLVSIAVTPASPSLNVGLSLGFIATGTFSDGSQQNLTATAVWASGTPSHATLGALTTTQAVNCIAAGTSLISATQSAITGSTTITCVAPTPTLSSIAVTPASPSITVGGSTGFIATGTYSDGSTLDVTLASAWTSGTPGNATIGTAANPQSVTCIAAGTSLIKATIGAVNGSTTLTCVSAPPVLASIAVTPTTPTQYTGSAVGFTATGTYSDGTTQNVTSASTWTSSAPAVASVAAASNPQTVNCLTVGSSTIKAAIGTTFGVTTLTCQTPVPPTVGLDAYCSTGNIPSFGASDGPATLPTACYYTDPSARPTTGTVRAVTSGTWTTVWAATACNDVVEMPQGAVFTGTFTIPAVVCTAGHYRTLRVTGFNANFPLYSTIRGLSPCYWGIASMAGYPPFNCTSTANRGATIQSTGTAAALILAGGFDGLQIEGIRITRTAGTGIVSALVTKTTGAHLILDRDWCAGTGGNDETTRCLNVDRVMPAAIINSLLTDFVCKSGGSCTDGQPISWGINNSGVQDGNFKMVNNFMTASGQACGLGGGAGANVVPSDIEIRLNWCFAPMTWNPQDASFAGFTYQKKNNLELKNSNRIIIEGNVFQNNWAGFSQPGELVALTPKNQNGGCPLCAVTNVTLRFNFGTTGNYAVTIANVASDSGALATAGNHYSIHDNVFENLDYATCYKCSSNAGGAIDGGDISVFNGSAGFVLNNVYVAHNDYIKANGGFKVGGTLGISGPSTGTKMTGFTWANNLALKETLPINNPSDGCSGGALNCYCNNATPLAILNSCFVSYSFAGNAIIANGSQVWPGLNCLSETSLANIFTAYNNGFNGPTGVLNYQIKTTSACHNSGTDGLDPGPDVHTLANRIQKVATF